MTVSTSPTLFQWKNPYACQIPEVDQQHKQLLQLVQRLYEALNQEDLLRRSNDTYHYLMEISQLMLLHCQYEESLLKEHQAPEAVWTAHHQAHVQLLSNMQKLSDEADKTNSGQLKIELIRYFVDWIERHLLTYDQQDFSFVREQQDSSSSS